MSLQLARIGLRLAPLLGVAAVAMPNASAQGLTKLKLEPDKPPVVCFYIKDGNGKLVPDPNTPPSTGWSDTDFDGDGNKDKGWSTHTDAAGNRLICVALQIPTGPNYIGYAYLPAGGKIPMDVTWFGKCDFKRASNRTGVKGKDSDGDGKPDVETQGPNKGKLKCIEKYEHDNIDKGGPMRVEGKLDGKKDLHYCYTPGAARGMRATKSKTKGSWGLDAKGKDVYKTTETMPCPASEGYCLPEDVPGYNDRRGSGGGGGFLARGTDDDPAEQSDLPDYFPEVTSESNLSPIPSNTFHYELEINPTTADEAGVYGRDHEFSLRAGDQFFASGVGITSANVLAPASLPEFGAWTVAEWTPTHVIFEATQDVLLSDLATLPAANVHTTPITGLQVTSDGPVGSTPASLHGAELGGYKLATGPSPWLDLGFQKEDAAGNPPLCIGDGTFQPGSSNTISGGDFLADHPVWLVIGFQRVDTPIFGGTLAPSADILLPTTLDAGGNAVVPIDIPIHFTPGTKVYAQFVSLDPLGVEATGFSNAIEITIQ